MDVEFDAPEGRALPEDRALSAAVERASQVLRGRLVEGVPGVRVRGVQVTHCEGDASSLVAALRTLMGVVKGALCE